MTSGPSPTNSGDVWTDIIPLAERTLSDEHRRILEVESGIDPDVIAARGYHSLEIDSVYLLMQHNVLSQVAAQAQGWLAIPIHRPDGEKHGEIIRLSGQLTGPTKYLWPTGWTLAMDVHPDCWDDLWDPDVPVIITEGIKKADSILSAARREDYRCVVASFSGNWGWRAKYLNDEARPVEDFHDLAWKDRRVYILVDSDIRSNDQVRRGWAELALYLQHRTGPHRTFMVGVPPGETTDKQGADDYLASGRTLASLLALHTSREFVMQERPVSQPLQAYRADNVLETAGAFIPHLVTPLIPEASVMLLAGHTGTFKTWAAITLCLDAAAGLSWLGHPRLKTRKKPVTSIYVNKEMSQEMFAQRLKLLMASERYASLPDKDEWIKRVFLIQHASLDLANPEDMEELAKLIAYHQAEIVVLDSLSMSWHGDENSASEVGALYSQLREVIQETGVTWVLLHHLLKPTSGRLKKDDPITASIRGSGQLTQQADVAILMAFCGIVDPESDERMLALTHAKARTDRELPPWVVRFSNPDGLAAHLEYVSTLTEARSHMPASTTSKEAMRTDWVYTTLSSMSGMKEGMAPSKALRLLLANWPVSDEKAPSESSLRRAFDILESMGLLERITNGKSRSFQYKLRERTDDEPPAPSPLPFAPTLRAVGQTDAFDPDDEADD